MRRPSELELEVDQRARTPSPSKAMAFPGQDTTSWILCGLVSHFKKEKKEIIVSQAVSFG